MTNKQIWHPLGIGR